jgi:hypothetical protein
MAAQVTKRDGVTTVSVGDVAVDIRPNDRAGTQWHCFAKVGGDFHGGMSGKTYKSDTTAIRAATKWVEAKAAQRAEDEASYQRSLANAAPKGPTPEWLKRVHEQWETSDVAEVTVKL